MDTKLKPLEVFEQVSAQVRGLGPMCDESVWSLDCDRHYIHSICLCYSKPVSFSLHSLDFIPLCA